jgi:pyridoxamine 5'-phosphate oxidase
MNIADIRKDYSMEQLEVTSVHADPIAQFQRWLEQAIAAANPEPTAMSLATVNAQGPPAGWCC